MKKRKKELINAVTLNLTCSFKQRNFKQAEDKRETFNLSMLHVHTHVHANIFICEFYMSSGGGEGRPSSLR